MENLIRKKDLLNNSSNLERIFKIQNFPIFMGTVSHPKEEDIYEDMIWDIGKDTGMIQLKKLIPLVTLYQSNHNSGLVGNLWNLHHEKFANFVSKFEPKKVFEIGGAHGILAEKYQKIDPSVNWTIIDPNPTPSKGSKVKFIKDFFDKKSNYDLTDTTIVHSHTLEHIYDPNSFLKNISQKVNNNSYQIISVPNIKEMIKRKYSNGLNFEHTYFLNEQFLKYFLEKSGFKIIEKEYFLEDHSIFICAKKISKLTKKKIFVKNYYKINKKIFLNFISYYKKLITELNEKIENLDTNVYLFGAHIFSQYLVSNGLNQNKIKCILDNDKNKQKKRLYGTSLYVESLLTLKNEKTPVVILKAGAYNDEIKNQIINKINKNCKFI